MSSFFCREDQGVSSGTVIPRIRCRFGGVTSLVRRRRQTSNSRRSTARSFFLRCRESSRSSAWPMRSGNCEMVTTNSDGNMAHINISDRDFDSVFSAILIFEVELVACKPRKGSSVNAVTEERARLADLKKQRELAAAAKEEEKKKREEAKAAAAARIQAKMDAKKNQGKGKGKSKR